ncbi:MAG: hypothetical protein KC613_13350, partial [Myxococcales bacterium]|nr:hypothetical protein [Myxococcales bacterium]
VSLIQKLFAPAKAPPKFSTFVPAKGWSAVRVSVNLKDLFSGIGDAIPPVGELEKAKSQIGMAPMMLPMVLGFGWDDLTGALSGHVVVAFSGESVAKAAKGGGANFDGVVLLGVVDGAKADKVVPDLLKQLDKVLPGGEIGATTVGGHAGHQVKAGPLTLAVVRVDDVLVAGPLAAVEAAVKRPDGEHLTDKEAVAALDGADVVEGVVYDVASLAAMGGLADTAQLTKLLGRPVFAGALRHDRHGLVTRSPAVGLAGMAGLAAGLALPAFTRYIALSKAAAEKIPAPLPEPLGAPVQVAPASDAE